MADHPRLGCRTLLLSRDGKRLVWSQNEHGSCHLYLRDEGQPPMQITGPAVRASSKDHARAGWAIAGLAAGRRDRHREIYLLTLGQIGAPETPRMRRLTASMLGGLTSADLVKPELVQYPDLRRARDTGLALSPTRRCGGPARAAGALIHGGPEGQERPAYQPFYHYLLACGIGMLTPNHRGSTGYGISYQKLVRRDFGGDDLKDFQASASTRGRCPGWTPSGSASSAAATAAS